MKKLQVVFSIFLASFLAYSATAQGRYNLRLTPQSINCATNKVVACLEIQATSADSAFTMGTANFRIAFKNTQLSGTPTISSRNNFTSGDYNSISSAFAAGADTSIFTVNIVYRGESGAGQMVSTAWISVAYVEFTLTAANTTKCYDLFLLKANPSTVVRRAVHSPTNDDPTRTLTVMATQGMFMNVENQCPAGKATVSLAGTNSIAPGQSTPLTLKLVSGDAPYSVVLTGGITLSNETQTTATVNVSPSITTTYEIQSVSNACGTGTADANAKQATITVIPSANCAEKCVPVKTMIVR